MFNKSSTNNLFNNFGKGCKDRDRSVIRNVRLIAFFKKEVEFLRI